MQDTNSFIKENLLVLMALVLVHKIGLGVNIYEQRNEQKREIARVRVHSLTKLENRVVVGIDFINFDNTKGHIHYIAKRQERITPMNNLTLKFDSIKKGKYGGDNIKFVYEASSRYIIIRSEIDKQNDHPTFEPTSIPDSG